ncbi:hypothetical protein B0H14DRAFT_2623513 [Mycena olivaceomarginata]|nr:hypothetical protein B0H14DRAFT_2623513 [Mycena olivaceomarginata]
MVLYYFDQVFTGVSPSPKVFAGISVQNRSNLVTYASSVHSAIKLPHDRPCRPAIPDYYAKINGDREACGEFFSIPQVLEYELLPSPFLSIPKLLKFPLPLEGMVSGSQPAQYFSTNTPDIPYEALITRVRRLPIPDSVIYSHLGGAVTHFPLWILTYWKAVVDIKRDVWGPWGKCQAWVNSQKKVAKKNPDRAALAEEAGLMLAMVPWESIKSNLWELTCAELAPCGTRALRKSSESTEPAILPYHKWASTRPAGDIILANICGNMSQNFDDGVAKASFCITRSPALSCW